MRAVSQRGSLWCRRRPGQRRRARRAGEIDHQAYVGADAGIGRAGAGDRMHLTDPGDVDGQPDRLRGRARRGTRAAQRPSRRRPAARSGAAPPRPAPAAAAGAQHPARRPRRRGRWRSPGTGPPPRRPGAARPRRRVPAWTSRPARISAIRSATAKASSWSWVTSSAVVPAATRMSRRSWASRSRSPRSSADSGSSSSSSRGSTASARARATRCRSPPDRAGGARSPNPAGPTSSSSSLDPPRDLARGGGAAAARSRRCRRRDWWGNSWPSWNISANPRRCVGTPARSAPS